MAVTGTIRWDEGALSAATKGSSGELHYILVSDDPLNDDRGDALSWMDTNAPDDLFGMVLDRIEVSERIQDEATVAMWRGAAFYVPLEQQKPKPLKPDKDKDKDEPQEVRLSVRSGGGGSRNMTVSRAFLGENYVGGGGSANPWQWRFDADIRRLLNVQVEDSEDSAAQFVSKGIDVPVGTVEIVVETLRLNESITVDGYLVMGAGDAAKNVINDVAYRGFSAHGLKLSNFDSNQMVDTETGNTLQNDEPWKVTFVFQYEPELSLDALDLPGMVPQGWHDGWDDQGQPYTPVSKRGWDYLDLLYVGELHSVVNTDPPVKFVIPKLKRASLHQVFEAVDFADRYKI